jgi:hypothetical protein
VLEWTDEQRLDQDRGITLQNYSDWSTRRDTALHRQARSTEACNKRLAALHARPGKQTAAADTLVMDFTVPAALGLPIEQRRQTNLPSMTIQSVPQRTGTVRKRMRSDDLCELQLSDDEEDYWRPRRVKRRRERDERRQWSTVESHEAMGHAEDEGRARFSESDEAAKRTKNYHNNLAYWNRFYDHLASWSDSESDEDLDEDKRDLCDGALSAPEQETVVTVTPFVNLLSEWTRQRLATETRRIVGHLLLAQMQAALPPRHHFLCLLHRLTDYYLPLIIQLVSLVASSPALVRYERRQRGRQSRHTSVQTVSLESEETATVSPLRPLKMCRALFLMLAHDYTMQDMPGNRITIWSADRWLHTLELDNQLHAIVYTVERRPPPEHGMVQKQESIQETQVRELADCADIIRETLQHYAYCPLWLRAHIHELQDVPPSVPSVASDLLVDEQPLQQ